MTKEYPERYGDDDYMLCRLSPDLVGERYVAWMADPKVTRFLQARFRRWDVEALRAFAAGFDHRDNFLFGIHAAASGTHVGTLTLRCNPHHHYGVIGFMLGEKTHWGRSAAKTAITAALDFAFFERRLRKVTATTFENHAVSNHIFTSLGFRMDGVVPDLLWNEGQYVGEMHFSLDAGEWAARRGKALPAPPTPPADAVSAR
jgi:RimJ/RimL family protein N-acetyltransferase